ncbi:XrtA system polysaccharide chain length determinant [Rhodoferax sp.]|uniref:XrtA system polysaccharide chain length determinant n=1 Tax=Rhodoferax sp. TaxID=50421 RepID=UPI0025F8E9DE|nr:XrtA system polysaccharide chain length determinant [Rhodoferax sp.]
MDELISQLLTFAKGSWKHRWLGLLVAWLVGVIGAGIVLRVPDKYEASARIYVDTQSILKPLMSGLAVQPNVDQQVGMLSRTLITRPNVEKLIRMADLDLGTSSKGSQDGLIEQLINTLQIKSTARDNLYTLSYQDPNPEKAKRVVQSLVSIFVESSLGDSRKDTDAAKKFITEQIKTYESKLESAEARLKEFKLRNIDVQTANGGTDIAGKLSEISIQLNQAKLDLREAENARDAAKMQLQSEKTESANISSKSLMQESAQSLATPEIDSRIEVQKRNLDGLLQRFTEQHPDVIGTRRLLKELEDQRKKEIQELRKTAMASPLSSGNSTLASQEMNRLLATSEVQVASLRARVSEYSLRYEKAREFLKTAPQTEAEYAQLNRDYAINKKNYEDLVSRRESASLSGDLESAAGVADFRLIDPPRVSPKPVAPNRLLLLLLALVVSLGAGGFTAFAASQLRPVFHDARTLRNVIDLPLLGVVTLVLSEVAKRKERSDLRKFFIVLTALIASFICLIAILAFTSGQIG